MITQQEFESILEDGTKRIEGDIRWNDSKDHPPAQQFRVKVLSNPGWPLTAIAWWNPRSGKLSYLLRHDVAGRIIGLDLGRVAHRNPTSELLDERTNTGGQTDSETNRPTSPTTSRQSGINRSRFGDNSAEKWESPISAR